MFDFLRRMIVPIMLIALVGFLATIIFSWGADITRRNKYESSNIAAVINGEEVSWTSFSQVYENLLNAERAKSPDQELTSEKKTELQNTAWSQIQFDKLLKQEVAKYNIIVTDDELYDFLKYSPPQDFMQAAVFQTNGQFDYQKYINALADPNYATMWASYDPYFRSEIKKAKLQEMIIQGANVTENEVKDYYINSNEKIKIGHINVTYAKYSNPGPSNTEEEIRTYYDEHLDNYSIPDRAVLKIASADKTPSENDWQYAKVELELIADSIANGADFAEMAKIYSQDNSASNGGDLGWFKQGQMVKPFDEKVFSMKEGEVSEPVRTQFGWHIIKNFGFRTEKGVKEVKASHILIKVSASQETLDIAQNRLTQFLSDVKEMSFDEAATKNSLTLSTTTPFVNGGTIQVIGKNPKISDFAFSSELNAISQINENQTTAFVVQLVEKIPAGVAPFEEARGKVTRDLLKDKVATMCHDTATVINNEIKNGTSFEKAAKNHGFTYEITDEFTRSGYVRGLNSYKTVIGAAFSLEKVNDVIGPIDYPQGSIIIKLVEKSNLDLTEFNAKKDSLSNVILQNKQQELFGRWYEMLVENSDIVNNLDNFNSNN